MAANEQQKAGVVSKCVALFFAPCCWLMKRTLPLLFLECLLFINKTNLSFQAIPISHHNSIRTVTGNYAPHGHAQYASG